MTSAVALNDGRPRLIYRLRRELEPNEVRVDVVMAGICRTDLQAARGQLACAEGRVLGHEICGVVRELGANASGPPVGTRVTVAPGLSCGDCVSCLAGNKCLQPAFVGIDLDGGFADEVVLPGSALIAVPPQLTDRQAAFVEPVAATLGILKAELPRNEPGMIWGSGRLAELAHRVLRADGFTAVTVAAPNTPSQLVSWAIETTGTSEGIACALASLRPGGRLVIKARPAGPVSLDVRMAVLREIQILAVDYGSFTQAVNLLSTGRLVVDDLLGIALPLSAFADGFALSESGEGQKIFLCPGAVPCAA